MSEKESNINNIADKHIGVIPITNIELRPLIRREDIHKKLSSCIVEMISTYSLPYYGEFCQFVNFFEANIGTCGVNIGPNGMNFYWDREWVERKNRRELIFTIVHEVFHFLFDHLKRKVGYDKRIANLAADMIINSIIHGDLIIGESLSQMIEIPKDDFGRNCVAFLPKEYDGEPIFEEVYHWLNNKYIEWKEKNYDKIQKYKTIRIDKDGNITFGDDKYCGRCGQKMSGEYQNDQSEQSNNSKNQNGQSENQSDQTKNNNNRSDAQDNHCQQCGQPIDKNQNGTNVSKMPPNDDGYGKNGKSGDDGEYEVEMYPLEKFFEDIEFNKGQTFDVHFDDDVSESVKKQFVENVMEKLKSRGLVSNNVTKVLNKLRKSEKDYLKEIKRILSNEIFGNKKNKSITRPNRRDIWGIKGKRKYKLRINCILDTSGSMEGEFEKVLSYIFQNDIEINLIQCDTEVKNFLIIKNKNELQKMDIKGLGGTTLTPGIQYIASNKELNKYNTVILTDGYTDPIDITGLKGCVLILSTSRKCPTVSNSKKLKQIIIEKNDNNNV